MGGVAPAKFPPPVDPRGVHRPADRCRGRAHRGRRRDRRRRPRRARLRDPADAAARARARAHGEAGRGAGRGDREGQDARRAPAVGREHAPVGDAGAVPRPRRVRVADAVEGRQGRRLPADREAGAAAEADAAELPQPRQLRGVGRGARALPVREGRGGGRLHPARDRRRQAARRGPHRARRAHRRQGARPRRQAARQLRARLRRDGQGDGARGGHARPPDAAPRSTTSTCTARTRSAGSSA